LGSGVMPRNANSGDEGKPNVSYMNGIMKNFS
jgi:hypothetical protein